MARAGGSTIVSDYKDAQYKFLCNQIVLDMPTRFIQDRALEEFGETLDPTTISHMRQPKWRAKNAQKWDEVIKGIEKDFISRVGDRKFLIPIFRFFYYKEWGELCAVKDSAMPGKGYHQAAIQYFNLCEKSIEHVPGHKLLAEACLSETVREIREAQGQGEQIEETTLEAVVVKLKRIRGSGTINAEKLLKQVEGETVDGKEVIGK